MHKKVIATAALIAALALTGCSTTTGSVSTGKDAAGSSAADKPAADKGKKVVYEVTSDAATISNVSYMTASGGSVGQESATDTAAPFAKEVTFESGVLSTSIFSLVGQATAEATEISCKITVDGEVKAEQKSTGAFSVVTCTSTK